MRSSSRLASNFTAVDGLSTDYTSAVSTGEDDDDDEEEEESERSVIPPPKAIPPPKQQKKKPPTKKSPAPEVRVCVEIPDKQTIERIGLGRVLCIQRSNAILFTLITTTLIGLYWFLLDRLTQNMSYTWVIAVYLFFVAAMITLYFAIPRVVSAFEQQIITGTFNGNSKLLKFMASWLIQDGMNIETRYHVLQVPASTGPVILKRVVHSSPSTVASKDAVAVAGRVVATPRVPLPQQQQSIPKISIAPATPPSAESQQSESEDEEEMNPNRVMIELSAASPPSSLLQPIQSVLRSPGGRPPSRGSRNHARRYKK
jgi:hypothetical protein